MILKTPHGNVAVETREANLSALIQASGGQLRSGSGSYASREEIAGIPAFQQGIRIAATGIAKHEMGVWRGKDVERRRISTTWQSRFFGGQPNDLDPWFLVWEQTEASLTARNNAYWLKTYDDGGQVGEVNVIHPDLVRCRWNAALRRAEYKLSREGGGATDWLTSREVLHF